MENHSFCVKEHTRQRRVYSQCTSNNNRFLYSRTTSTAHNSLVDNYVEQLLIGDPAMGLKETGDQRGDNSCKFSTFCR